MIANETDAIEAFYEAGSRKDEAAAMEILKEWPMLLTRVRNLLHWAAIKNFPSLVAYAIARGMPVDMVNREAETALTDAAYDRAVEACACLLRHGANVNYGQGERPTALTRATIKGCKELVQLLIDHGANVNASYVTNDGETVNALSFAEAYEHREIAALLRQHGAVLPDRSHDPPREKTWRDTILEHFATHISPSDNLGMHEEVPLGVVLLWIRKIPSTPAHPYVTVFSCGVSEFTLPSGETVELMLKLPPDWRIDRDTERDPRVVAPLHWLRMSGHALHDQPLALGAGLALALPRRTPADWPFAGFLFTPGPLPSCPLPDGRQVTIYLTQPIHGGELAFAQTHGGAALADRLRSAGIIDIYDENRPSVV